MSTTPAAGSDPATSTARPGDHIEVQTRSTATPTEIWHALVERHGDWWPGMAIEPVEGGAVVETWIEEGVEHAATGAVLTADAPSTLSFHWTQDDWPGPTHATVTFRIESVDGGTAITVSEDGLVAASADRTLPELHSGVWRHHLARLARAAERR